MSPIAPKYKAPGPSWLGGFLVSQYFVKFVRAILSFYPACDT